MKIGVKSEHCYQVVGDGWSPIPVCLTRVWCLYEIFNCIELQAPAVGRAVIFMRPAQPLYKLIKEVYRVTRE
jgi:hypothetical protein